MSMISSAGSSVAAKEVKQYLESLKEEKISKEEAIEKAIRYCEEIQKTADSGWY